MEWMGNAKRYLISLGGSLGTAIPTLESDRTVVETVWVGGVDILGKEDDLRREIPLNVFTLFSVV